MTPTGSLPAAGHREDDKKTGRRNVRRPAVFEPFQPGSPRYPGRPAPGHARSQSKLVLKVTPQLSGSDGYEFIRPSWIGASKEPV